MLPPELQKLSLTCPNCKKGIPLTLDVVFRKASATCTNCSTVLELQAPMISRTFQAMGDVEKVAKKIEDARAEYTKTVERFKSAVSDLVKAVKVSS